MLSGLSPREPSAPDSTLPWISAAGRVHDGRLQLKKLELYYQRPMSAGAQEVCLESALGVWPALAAKTLTK